MNAQRLIQDAPAGAAVATADTFRRFWRRAVGWQEMRELRARAKAAGPGHPVARLIEMGAWDELDWLCDELYGPVTGGKGAA